MKKALVIEIICFLFIVLFGYAALTKLVDYEEFSLQIQQSPLLTPFAMVIVWVIPVIEIIVAALLMIPRLRLMALYASFTLMIMFTLYIIVILNFADRVPCSCGGILEAMGWTEHLIFNVVFVVLGFVGSILYPKIETNKRSVVA